MKHIIMGFLTVLSIGHKAEASEKIIYSQTLQSDTLKVQLSPVSGFGIFRASYSSIANPNINPEDMDYGLYETNQRGLHEKYKHFEFGVIDTDFPLMAFQAIKEGKMNKENYERWFSESTPEELERLNVDQPVDTEISVAHGEFNGEKLIIIMTRILKVN
mgnify:CR=1 FL=1